MARHGKAARKSVIAVTGATGAQGGGLVQAILGDADGPFAVRAITRNPRSAGAQALQRQGAAVVAADLDDPLSLERAFHGAWGAFCVTNFWEHLSPDRELTQARNMADAARAAGLAHVLWSTLEDTRQWIPLADERMPTLMGRYKVPHFDAKGEANRCFRDCGVPTTYLLTSFYWDNFIHFGMGPQRTPDGTLAIVLPMGEEKLPGIASEDIGRCAYGVFRKAEEYRDKTVGIAGEHLTGAEMARAIGHAIGKPVAYNAVTPAAYRGFGFPGADDLGNMFQFNRDFSADFCKARSVSESRALNPSLQTFAAWLSANGSRIPLPD
ncbi:MAG TPA: NmrA/HSCARG family protein [Woeseiaceae bacterium]|nr:NmrA/HSCARG family protein [Woeseiaceae bacterium]